MIQYEFGFIEKGCTKVHLSQEFRAMLDVAQIQGSLLHGFCGQFIHFLVHRNDLLQETCE